MSAGAGMTISARAIVGGAAAGKALVAKKPLSFWGGLDAATGRVIDVRHDLYGRTVTGRVLFIPAGRGSSSSSGVVLETIRRGTAPAAIVSIDAEAILAAGSLIGKELYGRWVPVMIIEATDFNRVSDDADVEVCQDSIRIREPG